MLGRGRTGMLETIPTLLDALNRKDLVRQVVSFCHRMPFFFEKKASMLKRCVWVPVLADLLLLCALGLVVGTARVWL